MPSHESSVNYANLINDLAEMYPFDVCEVIITELVANSLDAHATQIAVSYDSKSKVLHLRDNGQGMTAEQFDEYHDFAAGLKSRGSGIGFAGLGAKISFSVADRVVTQTRSATFHGGSNWHLDGKKLVWEDLVQLDLDEQGTQVDVWFRRDTAVPYSTSEDLVRLLRRHFWPLTDPTFLDLYSRLKHYSSDFHFVVNGVRLAPQQTEQTLSLTNGRRFVPKREDKRYGLGLLGLTDREYAVSPDVCGVLICTRGKVIKAEMFNQFPGVLSPRVFGVVEVPDLAAFLTTSKTDFLRKGRNKEFEALYDPIRQEFRNWLSSLGVEAPEVADTDEARKLERELKRMLPDLPELHDFFGFRQKRDIPVPDEQGGISANSQEGAEKTFPTGSGHSDRNPGPVMAGDDPGQALVENPAGQQRATPISRTAKQGPKIAFAPAPEKQDLGWVDGNRIVINSKHPCYERARPDAKARHLHCILAIASAVSRFVGAGDEKPDMFFVDRMLAAWGKGGRS